MLKNKSLLSKILIWCLLLTIFTQSHLRNQQVNAEKDKDDATFIINDAEIGDGINKFQYYGPWGTSTGVEGLYNGDEHWSNAANWDDAEDVYFTVRFEGVSIKLFGIKDPGHGVYAVSIDGGEEIEVDAYSSTRELNQLLFESERLEFGEHVVKVRATGKHTGKSPDMEIDYAEITTKYIDVTGIEMTDDPLETEEGMVVQLTANVLPENATNQHVKWTSNDEDIATIDDNGMLKAESIGTTAITAETEEGSFTGMREVHIKKADHSLKGAVGTTNMHYVKENTFREDYKRVDFDEIRTMTDKTWTGNAWKGDRASAQFVLWTTNESKEDVSLNIENLVDGNGNKIASSNITADFVKTTKAARGRPAYGTQELIPDILNSDKPIHMDTFNVQPIWLSIDVPRDAASGDYIGELTVKSGSEEVNFNLELEVLDVTLPEVKDWDYFLDLWQNPYAVARINNISKDKLWTKEHFDVMKPHYEMLAEAGQKVITTTVTHDPWDSQTYDPYESMVKWTKKSDGSYMFDFEVFDKWVQFMMDLGIDQQIDAYSMVSWASKIKYYDEAQEKDIIQTVDVGTADWYTMWGAFLDAFVPHLEKKGWLDKTYMANDERELEHLLAAAELIEEKSDGRLKVTAAMNYNSLSDGRIDQIHNISLAQKYVNHDSKELIDVAQHRRSLGLNTTMYTMVNTYPSNFVRSNPAEPTWVIWYTKRHDVDGFLRWAYDSFVEDPFETTDYKYWESGDAFQVYPEAKSSIRFEKMKEGIRDAEKIRYISERREDLGEEISEALWDMQDVGYALDPYGGVKEPGIVSIPEEVDELQNVLYENTKAFVEQNSELSASDLKALVKELDEAGEIKESTTARALRTHLTAVGHYENKEEADKIVKHINGFKQLLDHQLDKQLISDKAYEKLTEKADALINQWK